MSVRNHKPCFFLVIFVAIPAILHGCGYRFRTQGEPIGIELKSLAIPMVTSTSTEIGFEADFTGMIKQEFISHAKVPLLPKEKAQTILKGHIDEIHTEALSFKRTPYTISQGTLYYETTSNRRLKVVLDIRLTDRETGQIIWHEKSMEEKTRYIVGSDPLVNRHNQQQALLKIAKAMAKRIYLKTMERF